VGIRLIEVDRPVFVRWLCKTSTTRVAAGREVSVLQQVCALLPIELAQELVDDHAAIPLQGSRDVGALQVLVEVVDSTADLVTVALGVATLPAAVRRIRAWVVGSRSEANSFGAELRVRVSGQELTVESSGDAERVLDLLRAVGNTSTDSETDVD
jgi:hypothetical protein